jgi:Ca2+-binding EF-hand superfamily protein
MMKYLTRTSTLTLTLAAAAPLLNAQTANQPPRGPMPFTAFDQDGNGVVTQQEFETTHAQRMAARAAAGAQMRGAANVPTFAEFDLDGDGKLMPDEFAQAQQARMQGRGMGPGAGGGMGPGAGPGMGAGGPGMGMGPGMGRNMPSFADFDLNGDGSLTEQEFNEAKGKRIQERSQQGYPMRNLANAPTFGAIDSNSDGRVDPQEFTAAQAQHRQQGMPPR